MRSPSIGARAASGRIALAHVFVDAVRRAARLELDDVGMHAALHEPATALVVADADQQRRELARRVLDARTARARRGGTRARAVPRRASQRLDRTLLPDHLGRHTSARD